MAAPSEASMNANWRCDTDQFDGSRANTKKETLARDLMKLSLGREVATERLAANPYGGQNGDRGEGLPHDRRQRIAIPREPNGSLALGSLRINLDDLLTARRERDL